MSRRFYLVNLLLLVSLFIYMFYRTEKTVVNEIVIRIISLDNYLLIKQTVMQLLPLNKLLIYSVPEGLWVFCITLTSKPYYIQQGYLRINCVVVPIICCIGLELLQLLHLTNGRFDLMDILISILCWSLANYFFKYEGEKQNILQPLNLSSMACLASYGIVYLAHVLR